MKVIGIDPWKKWGIAILIDGMVQSLHAMPMVDTEIHTDVIIDIIERENPDIILIEKVIGRWWWAANSIFKFGYDVGVLVSTCACAWYEAVLIRPQEWQKKCWIEEDIVWEKSKSGRRKKNTKATSLNAANRIFGVTDSYWRTNKRQRIAQDWLYDASLIAYSFFTSL